MAYQPKHKGRKCRVTEESQGLFIGRKHCATHQTHWDGDGPCPKQEIPMRVSYDRSEDRAFSDI